MAKVSSKTREEAGRLFLTGEMRLNSEIAVRLGVKAHTVGLWRRQEDWDGLQLKVDRRAAQMFVEKIATDRVTLAALVLGACEVNSQRRPARSRRWWALRPTLGRRSSLRRLARRRAWRPPQGTSVGRLHGTLFESSTAPAAVRGLRAHVVMRTPTRIASTIRTGRRSRRAGTKSFGGPACARRST